MTFLSPWMLAWLGLLAPLVLLYILKRRRETRVIGSTMLWEQALRDMRAERPWKKLIPQVALILQLLAIIAGAIALARPAGAGGVPSGAFVAVIVDTSASMAAMHEGEPRVDRARDVVLELARSLPPGGRMMLLEAGREPSVLAPLTSDGPTLELAARQIQVRGGSADLEAAVAIASERLSEAPAGSRIVLLTDAAEDGEIALDARAEVEVQRVGPEPEVAVDNTGIVDADVRSRVGEGPDRADIFARIRHFGSESVEVFVSASIDGRDGLLASRRITLEADSEQSVVMNADLPPDSSGRAAVVRIAMHRTDNTDDALTLDDVVVIPSPGGRRLPVFMVGTPPAPVERVLRADENVELYRTSIQQLAERDDDEPTLSGLFIYTGELPPSPPPGDSVVLAPTGDTVFELGVADAVENPRVVTWDEGDPRLRFVALSELHLARLRPLQGGAGRTLVDTDGGAAIASISRLNGETTVLGFDPAQSDWPRQASFVVFFRNLLERARDRRSAGGVAPGSLGEPLRVPAADGVDVSVETPSGSTLTAESRGGVAIVPVSAEPGVYRVSTGDRELHALRSLLDASESDVRARATFTESGGEATAEIAAPEEHAEAWPWLAALLLLLLAAEIGWATRRKRSAA